MRKSKKIVIESKLWILNVSIRDEKLGYGKLAKIFQEKTGRTINRSSIRKICLNKDELLRGLLRQNSFYDFLRKEVVAVTFQTCTPKTPPPTQPDSLLASPSTSSNTVKKITKKQSLLTSYFK